MVTKVLFSSLVALGVFTTGALADRAAFVTAQLDQYNANISAVDRNTKYCKMALSPFIFYRGTNHLFWADLAGDSRLDTFGGSGTKTWLQGDLHAENYGSYHNDENEIAYGLNDFDEAIIADYQYDLWRMATSLVLIMEQNGGYNSGERDDVLDAFTESYLDAVAGFRGNDDETSIYYTEENTYGKLDNFLRDVEEDESRVEMLNKWTDLDAYGQRIFDLSYEKLEAADVSIRNEITGAMTGYVATLSQSFGSGYFNVKSIAKRINAGTGSLGTPRYYVLIEGPGSSQDDDVILDVKLQSKPTAYAYLDSGDQADYDAGFANDAQRHMEGYKALTKHTDDLLGWMDLSSGFYSVRERSPWKETFDTSTLTDETDMEKMAEQWGKILAASHARADKDYDDALVPHSFDKEVDEKTDGSHSDFRALVRQVAYEYADQVEEDYAIFLNAYSPTCD